MLGHRLRRWPNIEPTLGQCIVFVGLPYLQQVFMCVMESAYRTFTNQFCVEYLCHQYVGTLL